NRPPDGYVAMWKYESAGHYANDLIVLSIEPDGSADGFRRSGELPLPQAVADHGHVGRTEPVFAGTEGTSDSGRYSERREEIPGTTAKENSLGRGAIVFARQRDVAHQVCGHLLKAGGSFLPVDKIS